MEDVTMRTYDFSPLFRSTVGFDRLFDMLDQATGFEPTTNWPPYNIEKVADDQYRITLAVAGFGPDEIEVTQHNNTLLVTGQKQGSEDSAQYLHRGIAGRSFKQSFSLADHVRVTGADLANGLLTVELRRELPEELRPRRIEIASGAGQKGVSRDKVSKQIEHEPQQKSKAA
jgi:molecular chaperone IbpA